MRSYPIDRTDCPNDFSHDFIPMIRPLPGRFIPSSSSAWPQPPISVGVPRDPRVPTLRPAPGIAFAPRPVVAGVSQFLRDEPARARAVHSVDLMGPRARSDRQVASLARVRPGHANELAPPGQFSMIRPLPGWITRCPRKAGRVPRQGPTWPCV